MFKRILRVHKLPMGSARKENRNAVVEFIDDRIVLEADIPEYPYGTLVDVSELGEIKVVSPPEDESVSYIELKEKERFYNLTKEFLCYKDFEMFFHGYIPGFDDEHGLCDTFLKNPFFLFDEFYFPKDVIYSSALTPEILCHYVLVKTFSARKYEIYAFIDYELGLAEKEGHTGIPFEELYNRVVERMKNSSQPLLDMDSLKNIDAEKFTSFLNAKDIWGNPTKFYIDGKVVTPDTMVYRKDTFNTERFVYESVKERVNRPSNIKMDITEFSNPLLSEEQKSAVRKVFDSIGNIFIISGGPGSGKTTIIDEIIYQGRKALSSTALIRIATPTGKAAKRALSSLSEERKNDVSVSTVHKFVGFGNNQSDDVMMDLESVMESTYLIIIDESSMMDIFIFEKLLSMANPYAKIVLVGDADQLSSVDLGDVLADLIKLNVPSIRLKENYRSGDIIVENARKINNKRTDLVMQEVSNPQKYDSAGFYFVDVSGKSDSEIVSMVSKAAENDLYASDNFGSGIIIAPRRVGVLSAQAINESIESFQRNMYEQQGVEPPYVFDYLAGDPIIINQTNYHSDTPYMNGETGVLVAESSSEDGDVIYIVNIDGNEVFVEGKSTLSLAYAISIHKSQGSEYSAVYIIAKDSSRFLTKRMLYTAVTRAKTRVYLFGIKEQINWIIQNDVEERHTYMKTAKPILEDNQVA